MKNPSAPKRPGTSQSHAFTLVELLVVIGIIALLISILLPALGAARRQAAAAKCAAQMREIGNAFQMYALESKGWYPVAQLVPAAGRVYNLYGTDYPTPDGRNVYWFNFVSKYVTKTKVGASAGSGSEADQARKSILWGCPAWDGYANNNYVGGVAYLQTGFGMNNWPTHSRTYPAVGTNHPPLAECVFITGWNPPAKATQGSFIKQNVWGKNGAERCLISDALFWQVSAEKVIPSVGMIGQGLATNTAAVSTYTFSDCNTTIDAYRHGKYPAASGDGVSLRKDGGKVSFNILFADGHVGNLVDRTQAFKAVRQRYPN